jgi:DNA helicase-2/ATP-dependent DNA helicase PcrA
VLPDPILRREQQASEWVSVAGEAAPDAVGRLQRLRNVAYRELIALDRFIDGHTPFATKHSVKGDEFENVLVVVGRGWNQYNFGQYLERASTPHDVPPADRQDHETNRNLPTTRLALLFTQLLPDRALHTLRTWFGAHSVEAFSA